MSTILQSNLSAAIEGLMDSIVQKGIAASGSLGAVGTGLASVFIMIVLSYYVINIIDGGKFQAKMLFPIAIYFCVLGFGSVAAPVGEFVMELSNQCRTGISASQENGGKNYDVLKREQSGSDPEISRALTGSDATGEGEQNQQNLGLIGNGVRKGVQAGVNNAANSTIAVTTEQLSGNTADSGIPGGSGNNGAIDNRAAEDYTVQSIGSMIINFIADVMRVVMSLFGYLMAAIIIAFGPITWAFAIIPGQSGTIKSWFIRLCQYSLWGPIAALIGALCSAIFTTLGGGSGSGFLLTIVMGLLSIVALTSVPSIASMIIEGASGAASLTSGLQHMASAAGIGGSVLAAGKKLGGGAYGLAAAAQGPNGALNSFARGWQDNGGAAGFIRNMTMKGPDGQRGGFKGAVRQTMADGHRANKADYAKAGKKFK